MSDDLNLNFDDLESVDVTGGKKAEGKKEEGYSIDVLAQFYEKGLEMTPVMQGRKKIGEVWKDSAGVVKFERVFHKNGTYKELTYNEAHEVIEEKHFKKDGSPAKKVGARKTLTIEKKLYGFYGDVKLDSILDDVSMNNNMTKSDLIHQAILGTLSDDVRKELNKELKKAKLTK